MIKRSTYLEEDAVNHRSNFVQLETDLCHLQKVPGPYAPTILKNDLSLVL